MWWINWYKKHKKLSRQKKVKNYKVKFILFILDGSKSFRSRSTNKGSLTK